MNKDYLENMIKEVLAEIKKENVENFVKKNKDENICVGEGVFSNINVAIEKANIAQKEYEKCTLETRRKIIETLRNELVKYVEQFSEMTVKETKMGKFTDKIQKNLLSIKKTPGVENLKSEVMTGDDGLTLVELSPFGVIGSVTPITNPSETIINNTISALSAGNSIVFCPHPGAKNISLYVIKKINEILGKIDNIPKNLVTTSVEVVKENVEILFSHQNINLLVITGGSEIVNMALKSGKKVIGAGAGNPPVIVDESANIPKAAKDIVNGASFDNNILCICEKSVLAVNDITDYLLFSMQKEGAIHIENIEDIKKIENCILIDGKPNKNYIGKDATTILNDSGVCYDGNPKLIVIETEIDHPFAKKEMMMPVLPVIRQKNFEEALENAIKLENGLRHTAIIHSQNVNRLSVAAREMKTTIFVKNAASYAGLGFDGEGYTGFTIAGCTGEGIVSAKDFTRVRRCVLSGNFYIR